MSVRATYHHGNLREAAVDEGLRLVAANSDTRTLSLRAAARTLGVSATALYRHFPDKDAWLGAIAGRGFDMLTEAQREAAADPGRDPLIESGRAYVHFAFQYPALFRLIFSNPPPHVQPFDTPPEQSAAGIFARAAADRLGSKASSDQRYVAALRAWTHLHGLTMLILHGQLPIGDIDRLMEQIIAPDNLVPAKPRTSGKTVPVRKENL